MSELYRLVYTSRNLLEGSEDERAKAVADILSASQANNGRVGVTGALLFNGGSFAQVLEGARAVVENTFERIQRDTRHSDVNVLQCEPVRERGFPNWSMAFVGHSARGRALWHDLASRTGFDLSRIEGEDLFSTLHAIVLAEEGMAGELPAAAPAPRPDAVTLTPPAFDAERLRAELSEALPAAARQSRDLPSSEAPRSAATGSGFEAAMPELAVLRASLADERQRVTDLRREIDDIRVALVQAERQFAEINAERDLWAGRTRALATLLAQDHGGDRITPERGASRAA